MEEHFFTFSWIIEETTEKVFQLTVTIKLFSNKKELFKTFFKFSLAGARTQDLLVKTQRSAL
jgi:hypothetical protein